MTRGWVARVTRGWHVVLLRQTLYTQPPPPAKKDCYEDLTPSYSSAAAKEKVIRPSDCYLFIDLVLNTQVWEMTD